MKHAIRPLAEINRRARDILMREMGVVDTLRFLGQFHSGDGNYTKERGHWLDDLSLDDIVTGIKAKRRNQRGRS